MSFRQAFLLGIAVVMAAAVAVFILTAKPAPRAMDRRESAAEGEAAEPAPAGPSGGEKAEKSSEPAEPSSGGEVQVVAEQEGETTRLMFRFPDPAGGGPVSPPSDVYTAIRGHWVLEMRGELYGISNCHLVLEEDATVSSPGEYRPVFEVSWSEYRYDDANRSFEASLSAMLRMGMDTAIPLDIHLTGKVSTSLREITGSFDAVPQGEMYLPYAQQGGFRMCR